MYHATQAFQPLPPPPLPNLHSCRLRDTLLLYTIYSKTYNLIAIEKLHIPLRNMQNYNGTLMLWRGAQTLTQSAATKKDPTATKKVMMSGGVRWGNKEWYFAAKSRDSLRHLGFKDGDPVAFSVVRSRVQVSSIRFDETASVSSKPAGHESGTLEFSQDRWCLRTGSGTLYQLSQQAVAECQRYAWAGGAQVNCILRQAPNGTKLAEEPVGMQKRAPSSGAGGSSGSTASSARGTRAQLPGSEERKTDKAMRRTVVASGMAPPNKDGFVSGFVQSVIGAEALMVAYMNTGGQIVTADVTIPRTTQAAPGQKVRLKIDGDTVQSVAVNSAKD